MPCSESPFFMLINKIKLICLGCCLAALVASVDPFGAFGQARKTQKPAAPAATPTAAAPRQADWQHFSHAQHVGTITIPGTGQTRELKCDTCHERQSKGAIVPTTERNKRLGLKFPGHKACVECHVAQFTAQPQQTCTICHAGQQGEGLSARPAQRDFPARTDFNAFFDARQHELHVAYNFADGKKLDCNFCHRQTAKPAVLNIASHPECYACHAPTSGDAKAAPKSGCAVCHTTVEPNAKPFSNAYVSRAYGAQFTHKAHVQFLGGNCTACHSISGGYNQPTPTSLKVKQHLSPGERSGRGCFSCHDGGVHFGRQVFSGEPGSVGGGSCQRCHTRADYKVYPSSG